MAAMKVTISAAMRARDVSRPHAEHLAFAEAAEADAVRGLPGGRRFRRLRRFWRMRPVPVRARPVRARPVRARRPGRAAGAVR